MTVTISAPTAGNRTITYTKTIASQKLVDIGEKAAHYIWSQGAGRHGTPDAPVLWNTITAQEKLDLLDGYISDGIQTAARAYHINDAVAVARATAEQVDLVLGIK
jgi:hypothetical protein